MTRYKLKLVANNYHPNVDDLKVFEGNWGSSVRSPRRRNRYHIDTFEAGNCVTKTDGNYVQYSTFCDLAAPWPPAGWLSGNSHLLNEDIAGKFSEALWNLLLLRR